MIKQLMLEFAQRTGLLNDGTTPKRYLWTDAFAVCNFLQLYKDTGQQKYLDLTLRLVDQVHHVLGRHRDDDSRKGWISGLNDQEGERHPTIGGLRIGKKMDERQADEPYDDSLEWDRDGQYFHYLTKWMHALNRVSRVTDKPIYNQWAMELAKTAHTHFVYTTSFGGQKQMYWKMSIDLSRPLVASMGQHDPLDGFITFSQIQKCLPAGYSKEMNTGLQNEINEMAELCAGRSWVTDDVLGLGGLMCDAWKVAQMMIHCTFNQPELLTNLLETSIVGLQIVVRRDELHWPAKYRLPFREFGLSIGLKAIQRLQQSLTTQPEQYPNQTKLSPIVEAFVDFHPLEEN